MKHLFLIAILFTGTLYNCQKEKATPPEPLLSGKKLDGRWYWVKSSIELKFDDGTQQNVSVDGHRSEWIEFKFNKRSDDNQNDTGTILKSGATGESSGGWVFELPTFLLSIQYSNPSGYTFVYRRVDEISEQLVLSANDALVLQQYTDNNLIQIGNKKLVGGSIFEQFER